MSSSPWSPAQEVERVFATGRLYTLISPPGALLTRYEGRLEMDGAEAIMAARREALAKHGQIYEFHEWAGMTSYTTQSRRELTGATFAERSRLREVHVLSSSRLVQMGLTVAALALGDLLHVYSERRDFEVARRRVLEVGEAPSAPSPSQSDR